MPANPLDERRPPEPLSPFQFANALTKPTRYLEPILKMSQGLPESDESAGEVQESKVMSANPLPAHEQRAKAVVPSVGALHDPAAWLALDAPQQRLLTAASDVRSDPASSDGRLGVGVVVTLVEAEVPGAAGAARSASDHRVERLADEPLVVDVGARDLGGQWDPPTVGQDLAFDAALRAIRGVRASEVPPFGAFTMALSSEDHFHWMPRLRS
jgi:hypothetical protein